MHQEFTAQGRAAARALSTFALRNEVRIVAGTYGAVDMTTEGGRREFAYSLRVIRWAQHYLLTLPPAPDSAELLADGEIFRVRLRTAAGVVLSACYWSEDAARVFRGFWHHSASQARHNKRQLARIKRGLNGGEDQTA